LERRRRRAVALLQQGLSLRQVARRVQASVSSLSQWWQAWEQGGDAALAPRPGPGRPGTLTPRQRPQLIELWLRGARASGFPNELGTLRRIAAVIQVEFGGRYHPAHIWKVLQGVDWSCQVPEGRAIQRDEQGIARGKRSKWPAIKQSLQAGSAARRPRRKRLLAHPHAPPALGSPGTDRHRLR
jgi:transposase